MEQKIIVGSVNYTNAKPLLYGLKELQNNNQIEIILDSPASIAHKWLYNEIDIGLVPVACFLQRSDYQIFAPYGIGSDGEVASVGILSECDFNEIENVYCDYQSRTSVLLMKLIYKLFLNKTPNYFDTKPGFETEIKGKTAGLVIGDRVFELKNKGLNYYDLGSAWKIFTGYPFVFATWASLKSFDDRFKKDFKKATSLGLEHLAKISAENQHNSFDILQYYQKNIKYYLNDNALAGLKHYLQLCKQHLG